MATTKTSDAAKWLTQRELCELTGLTTAEMRHLREQFGREVRGRTGAQRVYAPTMFSNWHASWKEARQNRNTDAAAAHARLKLAQAERQELALAKERNELIELVDVHAALSHFGQTIRVAGERIAARYGADAARILSDALEQSFDEFAQQFDN